MQVQIFNTSFGTIDKNQTVSFESSSDLESFFDELLVDNGYNFEGVTSPNFIKNLWRLYNEITIFTHSRIPLNVNYARIKPSASVKWFYFYIYDYEDLGNNQVKYLLKLDTMLTHVINFPQQGISFSNRNQLVLREHKDRFTAAGVPIYNKTLEDVDVKPTVLNLKYEEPSSTPYRLVLKKFGGAVVDNEVVSYPIYAYDVHGPITSGNTVSSMVFTLPLGWGFRAPNEGESGSIAFEWSGTDGDTSIVIVNKQRYVRHSIDNNGDHYLEIISGSIFDSSNVFITGPSASIETNGSAIKLNGDGVLKLYADGGPLTFSIIENLGFVYGTPLPNISRRRNFAQFTSLNRTIRPYSFDSINYTESKTQKIIELPISFSFNQNSLQSGTNGARIPLNSDLGIKQSTIPMSTKTFNTAFSNSKAREPLNDPKLYHSQFRPRYLSYLSESILLRRESLINTTNAIPFSCKLNESDYSKMMLYSTIDDNSYQKSEMYELSKIIDLNNEISLIKDDFNQYLDSNYRSDQRLRELQIARANRDLISSSVNQVVGIGAGIVGGAIAGNVAGAVIGGVTGTVRAVTNISNGIKNLNQMKEELKLNYEQKIKSLQYSLINITGANPEFNSLIDSNKLKLFEFLLKDEELNYLDTYFHLYGYNTLEYKVPNLKTRFHFNFIQMELVNYIVVDNMITTEVLEDIKERFRNGLTILHANMIFGGLWIDRFLELENYERVLIP